MATTKKAVPAKAVSEVKQVKMTPEIMKKLRGFSIVSGTVDHVIEIKDVPEEFFPTFTLKSIKLKDVEKMKEIVTEYAEDEQKLEEYMLDILQANLVGWKQIYDISTGEEFVYDGTEESFNTLPLKFKLDLVNVLYEISGLI